MGTLRIFLILTASLISGCSGGFQASSTKPAKLELGSTVIVSPVVAPLPVSPPINPAPAPLPSPTPIAPQLTPTPAPALARVTAPPVVIPSPVVAPTTPLPAPAPAPTPAPAPAPAPMPLATPTTFPVLAAPMPLPSPFVVTAAPGKYASGQILETGGSNYTFFDMGNAGATSAWDGTVRPVIGTYNLNPSAVEAQMRELKNAGQKKITFMLWYAPFDVSNFPGGPSDVWIYIVNSKGGNLSPQAQLNLQAVLRLVKIIGFEQVTLRFGQQGNADPLNQEPAWANGWNEAQYQENLNFIINTRNVMENELASTSIARMYDLGVEIGGVHSNQGQQYCRRLWSDYVTRFGKSDSYGFSVAVSPGRLATLIQDFDASAGRPSYYALDAYGQGDGDDVDVALRYSFAEMQLAGDAAKPIIIQETFANDSGVAQKIVSTLNSLPITIHHIDQWPVTSDDLPRNLTASTAYAAYGGSSAASGSIVAQSCVLGVGQSLCTSQISWSTVNAPNVKVYVNGQLMAAGNDGGTVAAPWISSQPAAFALYSDYGFMGGVTISAMPATTPTLDLQGAEFSGADLQSISATGSNIAPGCIVRISTADGSVVNSVVGENPAVLARIDDADCQAGRVTFKLPAWISQYHSTVNIAVSNSNLLQSNPVLISIKPLAPAISNSGLACNGTCLWIAGANINSGCSVSFFTPDWSLVNGSPLLATLTNVSCQINVATVSLPSWIQQQYDHVNINMSNSNGTWSSPIYASTH